MASACPISSIWPRTTISLLTPTFLSSRVAGKIDWQRLSNGSYNIRAIRSTKKQPEGVSVFPFGAGDTRLRGAIKAAAIFFSMTCGNWAGTAHG